jgi:hypothetical protein
LGAMLARLVVGLIGARGVLGRAVRVGWGLLPRRAWRLVGRGGVVAAALRLGRRGGLVF